MPWLTTPDPLSLDSHAPACLQTCTSFITPDSFLTYHSQGTVIMGTQMPSVYHQVIETTKGQSFRTSVLLENIDKRGQGGPKPQQVCVRGVRV